MTRSGINVSRIITGLFSPILTKGASLLFRIKTSIRFHDQAYEAIKEIGSISTIRHWPDQPHYVEIYGEGNKIKNWLEAELWLERTKHYFWKLDVYSKEVEIEFYLVDRNTSNLGADFGTIYADDDGRRHVQFTFGGPRIMWQSYPLSSYRLESSLI